jgi:hypothetical protein
MKWIDLIKSGELNGYQRGYPGTDIDRSIAEADPCQICGGDMEYVPMVRNDTYRAFARCFVCGETEEF